jgi:type VI protein secretion system component VasF
VNNYNIDELCKYINGEQEENNNKKKSGKKGKSNNAANLAKKKNSLAPNQNAAVNLDNNNSNSKSKINQRQNDNIQQICFETDKEIEEFRKKLTNNSIYANSVKKVKPKFSFEWIQSLPININN